MLENRRFYYGGSGRANNAIDIYYNCDDEETTGKNKKKKPILIYVEGGGWTGHDHINDPTTVPQLSLQEGYVCVVIHHRPIRFNPGPLCALLLAALFVSFDVLSFSFYTLLALSAATALLIEIAVNRFFHTDPSNMANVVNDVARGLAHVCTEIKMDEEFKGDVTNLTLLGSSSGGHLLSLVVLNHRDWLSPFGIPLSNIKMVINISGILSFGTELFFLFRWFIMCVFLDFDFWSTAADDLSPIFHARSINGREEDLPCFVQVTCESDLPSVSRLNDTFQNILKDKGCSATRITIPGHNHFTTIRKTDLILKMCAHLAGAEPDGKSGHRQPSLKTLNGSSWVIEGPKDLHELSKPDSIFYFSNFTVTAVIELQKDPRLPGGANSLRSPQRISRVQRSEIIERLNVLTSRHPILRCRIVRVGSSTYWQNDLTFDASNHITTVALNQDEQVRQVIREESQKPLSSQRPLWRLVQVVLPSGKMVLVLKIHHCIGDGGFITSLLLPLLDKVKPATPPVVRKRRKFDMEERVNSEGKGFLWKMKRSFSVNILASMKVLLKQPYMWVLQGWTLLNSRYVSVNHHVDTTFGISPIILTGSGSVDKIRNVIIGASVSDIILCAIASVIRKKLIENPCTDASLPLLMFMPVMGGYPNMEALISDHEGNAISGFLVALPVHLPTPKQRLKYLQEQTKPLKKFHVAAFIGKFARFAMNFLPRILLPHVIRQQMKMANFLGVSSFRGPYTAQLFDNDLGRFYFFGIFDPPVQPFMCAISSVGDRLTVTLVMKTSQLGQTSAQGLVDLIPAALENLANDVAVEHRRTDTGT